MSDISKVLVLTRTTFDLYNKAISLFENNMFDDSCNYFSKVIFNLYSIKKLLNSTNIEIAEKKDIYSKIKEALKKSFEYARKLDVMDVDNNDSDEDSTEIMSNELCKIQMPIILRYAFEGDIINLEKTINKISNINLNISNSVGESVLHISVRNGDTRMTEILLKAGANINSVTNYGFTPIEIACVNRDFKMIALLQEYGCKLEKLIALREDINGDPSSLKSNKIDFIIIIKKLISLLTPYSIEKNDSFFKIKEYIVESSINSKKKVRILSIIDDIEKSDVSIGWGDIKESDVFQLVWNAIFSNYFISSSKDLVKILIEEIYYSYDSKSNLIICPSTKYERIIYSLAGFRPDLIKINPDFVLNQELILFALNLRNKILNNEENIFRKTYNASIHTEEQIDKINNFNYKFKKILINNLKKSYIQTKILKEKELNMIINKWINII
jgi:ankyrin repeat protein